MPHNTTAPNENEGITGSVFEKGAKLILKNMNLQSHFGITATKT
jgi:hypothetical protein